MKCVVGIQSGGSGLACRKGRRGDRRGRAIERERGDCSLVLRCYGVDVLLVVRGVSCNLNRQDDTRCKSVQAGLSADYIGPNDDGPLTTPAIRRLFGLVPGGKKHL